MAVQILVKKFINKSQITELGLLKVIKRSSSTLTLQQQNLFDCLTNNY